MTQVLFGNIAKIIEGCVSCSANNVGEKKKFTKLFLLSVRAVSAIIVLLSLADIS